MPRCMAIRRDGASGPLLPPCQTVLPPDRMHYLLLHDPRGRLSKPDTALIAYMCPRCAGERIGRIMETEAQIEHRIQVKSARAKSLVRAIPDEIAERGRLWSEVKFLRNQRTEHRNKQCRLCGYALDAPEEPAYQVGPQYAHANVHTPRGYGRVWLLFHTECFARWLSLNVRLPQAALESLRPERRAQATLREAIAA